ncbi:methyl-accepting chemotaxis protein [Salinibacter altiplanensis]|uniref:methyl-accepting chemotaxis protein n=1 Tax=Salinibacter altiplanensis TaxID=1803181 RepID=UPI000C9F2150|nr:methyl-accepting chemotaxis protein [Salinibacter altiplanensis]
MQSETPQRSADTDVSIDGEALRERTLQYLRTTWTATSRQFAGLLVVQWILTVVLASVVSAEAWAGAESAVGSYVWTALVLGGGISLPAALAAWTRPDARLTRHIVGIAQLLMSGLLIYLAAGRIEMHFHIFASLAFLGLYYDWTVLVSAAAMTAVDHFVRSIFWPMSMFGVTYSVPWMAAEHSAWVIFEVGFLTLGCLRALRVQRTRARTELENEAQNDELEVLLLDLEEAQQEAEEKQEKASRAAETAEEISRFLRVEIEDLDGRISRLEEGDLTVSFTGEGATTPNEKTEQAAEMTGRLRAKLEGAVRSIRSTLRDVVGATGKASASADEISTSSDQMAASAEQQSAQAEEVAAAVEELNQTINENAQSVQSVAESAGKGSRQAQEGQEVVAEATGKMKDIAREVQGTAETIDRLQASSEEISQVVETIDEIAGQTNLLALNAAIEAARAGGEATGGQSGSGTETGQGFAVVAEEVRELADETDQATSEIASIIGEVQSEIQQAVEAARQSSQNAEEGIELSEKAGGALDQIVASIEEVEAQADEIAAASEEQSTTSKEIARSVQSISTAAQESAAGVTEVSDVATSLDRLTEDLRTQLHQFVLGEDQQSARTTALSTAPDGPDTPPMEDPSDDSGQNRSPEVSGDGALRE